MRRITSSQRGATIADELWDRLQLDHGTALDCLFEFLCSELAGHPIVGVGHRVVHGALDFAQPVVVDAKVAAALERLIPLAVVRKKVPLLRWASGNVS